MRPYRGITWKNKKGRWIIGWYSEIDDKSFITLPSGLVLEVLPETVGQQVGKKDRNGKEIYKGDIIEWYDATVRKGTDPMKRQVCRWNNLRCGFDDCFSGGEIIGNTTENKELLK